MPLRPFALLLVLAVGSPAPGAQTASPSGDGPFTAEAVRADLADLYETLQEAHYDLYVYADSAAYDARYREALAAVDGPMTRLDVARLVMPLVAYGDVGHARLDFPVADYVAYVTGGGTLLPFDVRVEGDSENDDSAGTRVFVAHSYADAVRPGDELVALDGRSAAEWVERLGRYASAERPYLAHAQLETFFPRLLWLDRGPSEAFEVTLRRGGSDTTFVLPARDALAVEQAKAEWEAAPQEREARMLPDGVAYLRPGPFYAAAEGETVEAFTAFVDGAFRQFVEAGAADLVLDLRGNPGGDNSFSDPLVAWVADRPFRFTSDYRVRASAETRRVLAGLAAEDPDGVSARMLRAMAERADGERFAFEIPEVEPRADSTFDGRVWALVDRTSFSNATAVAAVVQDYGFGTVIGEETADLPTSYASSAQFTLPNTGLAVTYPKGYFVRPSGDGAVRGVVPDVGLERPVAAGAGDAYLDAAVDHVLSQRE